MFAARLDAVTETASQVLVAAAVIGRTFDVETVRQTSGRSDDEVVTGLEELAAWGLIIERDAEYDFAHERLRSPGRGARRAGAPAAAARAGGRGAAGAAAAIRP